MLLSPPAAVGRVIPVYYFNPPNMVCWVRFRGFNHRRSPVGELERILEPEEGRPDVHLQDDAVEVVAWLRSQG